MGNFTGRTIKSTYQRVVQIDSGSFQDGLGNPISGSIVNLTASNGFLGDLEGTASFAITASYAYSASYEIIKEVSSSHADTASSVDPLNQNVFIDGGLILTGSYNHIGNTTQEGNLILTGSLLASGSSFEFVGPITSSSNISASGDITSNNIFTGNISSSGSITHTGSINLLSSSISVVDYIDFNNTGITPPPDIEGRIYWDEGNGTLSLGMNGGQVVQQVGLEEYFYIKNQSGATIPNGSVVRAAGTLGASGRILGDLMIADGSITYYFTLGIATEDIINGDEGYVTQFGAVRGINTTGTAVGETWNDGDILWVSPTTLGGLTKFEPDSPNLKMQIGIVINAASNGTLFVRPDLSSFLTDLHNVNDFTTTSSFGDILVKSGSTWINTNQLTGSYGLTGSLNHIGLYNQVGDKIQVGDYILTGSFNHSGSLNHIGNTTQVGDYELTGSFNHLGDSTQIGNNIQEGDFTLTGSFNHTGSYNQIGDKTQIGNYELTGSFNHSGSYDQIGDKTQIGDYNLTGSLGMSGSLQLQGGLQFDGTFGEATLTANTDDLVINNLVNSILVRLESTSNVQLTGIEVPDQTKTYFFTVFNVGTNNIIFKNNNVGSLNQNRFLLGGDVTVQGGEGLTLIYDPVDLKFRSPGKNI